MKLLRKHVRAILDWQILPDNSDDDKQICGDGRRRSVSGSVALIETSVLSNHGFSREHHMTKLNYLCRHAALMALVLLTTFVSTAAQEQPLKMDYRIAMSQPSSHLFEVKIEVEVPQSWTPESLDFQMPKWAPGRYAVFDFAKNVQEFHAFGGICPRVNVPCTLPDFPVRRVDDQTWRVTMRNTHSATITYKVFGNDLSGTFSQLDSRHANF
ncbi:MAG TPA: hypothetical protein VGJ69_04230, partial [Pyrinomonadaceae bacterium]